MNHLLHHPFSLNPHSFKEKSFNKIPSIYNFGQNLSAPPQLSQIKPISAAIIGGIDLTAKSLKRKMDNSENTDKNNHRSPLSAVVYDCVNRWFQDTLKEAKAGDVSMQVLVGQMYNNGYGVAKDADKARKWISKASRRNRSSSVWKVSKKHPGYNASDSDSDSDSDDLEEDSR